MVDLEAEGVNQAEKEVDMLETGQSLIQGQEEERVLAALSSSAIALPSSSKIK